MHLQFCKRLLGVKKRTQNDFVYGELGRTTCIIKRYLSIINIGSRYYIRAIQNILNWYIS